MPPSLVDLVHVRLQALPESTRPLLQAASILKGDFEMTVLGQTAGYREEQTLEILDLLLEAAVFVEHGNQYSFTHPLVATLVYNELSVARRRYLHGRAAAVLEATYSGRLAPIAADLVDHYAGCDQPAKVAFYADMAAGWAMGMAAPKDAADFYRQAYLWEPTLEHMTNLGQALAAAGDMAEAQNIFRKALAAYKAEGDQAGTTRAQLALAGSYMLSGEREQVVHWASRALKESAGILVPEMEAQAHLMMAMGGASDILRLSEAEGHLVRAGELAEANGLVQLALQCQFERANLLAQRGELEDAVALFALTAAQARAGANPVQEMLAINNLAYHEHLIGDLSAARDHIELALAMSENYSLVPFDQYLFSTRGEIALAGEDFDEAEQWFERAMAAAVVANNEAHQANLKANMGMLARARGDLDTALLLLQEARAGLLAESESFLKTKIDLWTVELHLVRGERAAAAEVLTRVKGILAQSEYEGFKHQANAIEFR
jgi:tetratricopeptide (TPR) repeat protein